MTDNGERWKLPMSLLDALLYAEQAITAMRKEHTAEQRLTPLAVPPDLALALPERMPHGDKAEELMRQLIRTIDAGFQSRALQGEPHMVLLREDFYDEGDRFGTDGVTEGGGGGGGGASADPDDPSDPRASLRALLRTF